MNIENTYLSNFEHRLAGLSEINARIAAILPEAVLSGLTDLERDWLVECWSDRVEQELRAIAEQMTTTAKSAVEGSIDRYEHEALT